MSLKDALMRNANAAAKKKKKEKGTVAGEIEANLGGSDMLSGLSKKLEGMKEARIEMIAPGTLNKKVNPGFVPVGLNSSLFTLNKDNLNAGQVIRRNVLDNAAPKLNKAIASGDIFAYNSLFSNLRTMISRTSGGPKVEAEMPDPMEIRRKARLKRRPMGSREQNMMGIF